MDRLPMNSPGLDERTQDHSVVLFDGECGFCNRSVQFIADRDPAGIFRFAPLQSATGRSLAAEHGLDPDDQSSLILIEQGRGWVRSTAALRICRRLRRPWSWCYGLIVIPRPIRDLVYRAVARVRRRIPGGRSSCRIPTPEFRSRLLD